MRAPGLPLPLAFAVATILLVSACAPAADDPPGEELTRRERDSLIGASRLPGAGGVRGAMSAADSATARNLRLDSLASR